MAKAYRHDQQSAWLEQMKFWVNRRALSEAAAVVTWSKWAAESVVGDYRIPADRVHPIFPGVDIERFRPTAKEAGSGPIRVLFVGGDFTRKGGSELVDAVSNLGGSAELDLVTSATDVRLPGNVPIRLHRNVSPNSAELLELMEQADVFALPTRGDSLALAICEAMACGLPVVATTVGAIPNMINDGLNGFLVPPGDTNKLAAALRTLASDGALRQRMGAAGRALAEAQHDTANNWRRIFALMTAAADCRPDPKSTVTSAAA
jgi:glycosyltransferase involved in cell wall biosynthesis